LLPHKLGQAFGESGWRPLPLARHVHNGSRVLPVARGQSSPAAGDKGQSGKGRQGLGPAQTRRTPKGRHGTRKTGRYRLWSQACSRVCRHGSRRPEQSNAPCVARALPSWKELGEHQGGAPGFGERGGPRKSRWPGAATAAGPARWSSAPTVLTSAGPRRAQTASGRRCPRRRVASGRSASCDSSMLAKIGVTGRSRNQGRAHR